MGLALTNPGIQYEDQQPQIDPTTGQPLPIVPNVKFFKNKAARGQQFIQDVNATTPNIDFDQSGNASLASSPATPKLVDPNFLKMETPNPNTGEPNAPPPGGMTKLGKLFDILGAAARGAAYGAGQPNFGAGFQAAQERPIQMASLRNNLAQQEAQTALTRQQATMVQTPYGPLPAGLAKVMFPALINAGSREKVQQLKGNTAESIQGQKSETAENVADKRADTAETIAGRKLDAAPGHTITTAQGVMQWNPETKSYDKFVGGASQGKMGSVPPEVFAQLGAPPTNDPEKLRAWGTAAEAIKNREAAASGMARGQAYGAFKPVQVINPDTGNLEWMYAGQAVAGGAAPASEGAKTMSKQQQFQEMHYASGKARDAINGLDRPFSSGQIAKLTMAMSHDDPTVRSNEVNTLLGTQQLTPAQEDFVVWINQLNERALSLRNIAGMGQGAQDLRAAIQSTLPGVRSGSKEMAIKQLNAFENQVKLLEKGIPKVKTPNSTGVKPAGTPKSIAERDKSLGVVYATK